MTSMSWNATVVPSFGSARVRIGNNVAMTRWPAALLFDMDGTLIESHANVDRAWATWATLHGLDPEPVLAEVHGLPADVTVARWFPDASPNDVTSLDAEQLRLHTTMEMELIDKVVIFGLRHNGRGPSTSADAELVRVRLGAASVTPQVLVTRDQVANGKPAPDGYLRAADALDIPADRCIVVEDTDVGIAAAAPLACARPGCGEPPATFPFLHQRTAPVATPSLAHEERVDESYPR